MERALLNLLGVAMAHLAMTTHQRRAACLPVEGSEVIAYCVGLDAAGSRAIIAGALSRFWPSLAAEAMELAEQERQIDALASLIAATSTATDCAASDSCQGNCADSGAAERLARNICARNVGAGQPEALLPGSERCSKLLTALFKSLLSCGSTLPPFLDTISDLIRARIAAATPPQPRAAIDELNAVRRQLARDTGIPLALLDAIIEADRRLGMPIEATIRALVDRTIAALELLGMLNHLADRAGSDDAMEAAMLRLVQLVRSGNLSRTACELAVISRNVEAGADFADRLLPDLTGTAFFPTLLAARARLAGLDGEPRESARLYDRATIYWARDDRIRRWQLKLEQARALARLGHMPGARLAVLCEAAQVYAAAGGLISERDAPQAWAEANLELGTLLLEIGNRECRPERYLAAALHFKPALEVFTRERHMDGWARAQVGLANALRGQASFQGDVVVLREAVFAYRAALGILTAGGTPEDWHTARACLGDALVRIAEEAGDVDVLQVASDLLVPITQDASPHITPYARSIGEIALGRTLLFIAETDAGEPGSDADNLVAQAIDLIARGLEHAPATLTPLEEARARAALGAAWWLRHTSRHDPKALDMAIVATRKARDLYEGLENPIEAGALDERLAQMQARPGNTPNAGTRTGDDRSPPIAARA